MTGDRGFSLESAQQASDEGRLDEWVVDFLASPGSDNAALAAKVGFESPVYFGPVRFELDRLTPMAGPDEDEVVVPIDEQEWESDVARMQESAGHGWEPPPLLVSARDDGFFLEDGNHRHETLRRSGATHAWVILLFADEEQRDRFAAESSS